MGMLPKHFILSPEVVQAQRIGQPIVALESAVITHGLPRPQNLELAVVLEKVVRSQHAIPATIGLIDGKIHVGLSQAELERLANAPGARKISRRDIGVAIAYHECGGTTVAGTLIAAHTAGLKVFATGGIGGVHRAAPFDVSTDLEELGRSPLVVVCAGAKAILDLAATLEVLETRGVPVIGFQTDEFPAFYSIESGLSVTARADTPEEVARIAEAQWQSGIETAVLVVVPPPAEFAIPAAEIEKSIQQALLEAQAKHVRGAAVTPFLLDRVSQISHGSSLRANLALLENNARVAAQIAGELSKSKKKTEI
jgi:pseudouridine-5'-phosphate glycosidase